MNPNMETSPKIGTPMNPPPVAGPMGTTIALIPGLCFLKVEVSVKVAKMLAETVWESASAVMRVRQPGESAQSPRAKTLWDGKAADSTYDMYTLVTTIFFH